MSRPPCTGTVVARPSEWRNCLCEPRCRTSSKPRATSMAITSRGLRTGTGGTRPQATTTACVPTYSPTITGSPSSRSMAMTSLRLPFSSSRVAPLAVGAGKSRNISDKTIGIRTALDNGGVCSHRYRNPSSILGANLAARKCRNKSGRSRHSPGHLRRELYRLRLMAGRSRSECVNSFPIQSTKVRAAGVSSCFGAASRK